MTRIRMLAPVLLAALAAVAGCSTAPKQEDRAAFQQNTEAAMSWFAANVNGLDQQIADSGGYVIFPDVAQWGIVFTGGKGGRGAVYDDKGRQVGWAAIGGGSLGLQLGAQGYKLLMVFENAKVLEDFKNKQWSGSAQATAVAGTAGAAGTAPFRNGVAVYSGDQAGLMAGVSVALENVRYLSLDDAPIDG